MLALNVTTMFCGLAAGRQLLDIEIWALGAADWLIMQRMPNPFGQRF